MLLIPLAPLFIGIVVWVAIKNDNRPFVYMEGKALGVFYSIVYQGDEADEKKIDSIITAFDLAINTDRLDSEISEFNRKGYLEFRSPYLSYALQSSLKYTHEYQGAVTHMVLPLIKAWGQEFSNKRQMSAEKIEELKQLCRVENLEITAQYIRAKQPRVMINFSYLDKGLLIDLLTNFLLEKGVKNFQLEFGTDAISYGKSPKNNNNRHVVLHPHASNLSKNSIKETPLKNKAYSSSGNLEEFYVDEQGFKHSHLIDPRTGRPIDNSILSTHIKAPTCLEADALATLCMILTLKESSKLITENPELEGLIVYNEKVISKYGNLPVSKSLREINDNI